MTGSSPTPRRVIGALDIGSNAIRLAIACVEPQGRVVPLLHRREPLRLGTDVFRSGSLAPQTLDDALRRLGALHQVLRQHRVTHVHAVATSAVRTAVNGPELVRRAREEVGMDVRIIDGREEASLVLLAVSERVDLGSAPILLVDVGGGSVEVTLARDGGIIDTVSLPLGPVRLLERLRADRLSERDAAALIDPQCTRVASMLRAAGASDRPVMCIGVGGSVEALASDELASSSGRDDPVVRLDVADLGRLSDRLAAMPVDHRISLLRLQPDRADLIGIAAVVVIRVMQAAAVETMMVPGVSLIDGVLLRAARGMDPTERGPGGCAPATDGPPGVDRITPWTDKPRQ